MATECRIVVVRSADKRLRRGPAPETKSSNDDVRCFGILISCSLLLLSGHFCRADEPEAARREQVERMGPDEKEQLRTKYDQFQSFEKEERERLRCLHREIENDPDRDELRRVMDRYYEWLESLSSYQLMELRKLSPAERIEKIKSLKEEQHVRGRGWGRAGFGRFGPGFERSGKLAEGLSPADKEALLEWCAAYAVRHEEAFLERLAEPLREKLRLELDGIDDPRTRNTILFWRMWLRWKLDEQENPLPGLYDDLPGLLASLSPEMREMLAKSPPDERGGGISARLRGLAMEHYFFRGPRAVPSVISEEELADFVTNKLDERGRSWVMGQPSSEERQRMAWRSYLMTKLPPMGPGGARRPGSQRRGPPQRGGEMRPDFGRPGPPGGARPGMRGDPRPPENRPDPGDKPGGRSENGGERPR